MFMEKYLGTLFDIFQHRILSLIKYQMHILSAEYSLIMHGLGRCFPVKYNIRTVTLPSQMHRPINETLSK
jgi:hypothetical protein